MVLLCCLGGARPTAALTDTAAEEGGAGEWSLSLSAAATPDSPEGSEAARWTIGLSVPDDEAPLVCTLTLNGALPPDAEPDAPAAACITVDASGGWRILSVGQGRGEKECPPDESSLTLSVEIRGARAVILADGDLKDLVGLTILLTLEADGEACSGTIGTITAACPEGIAFYNQARGGVDYIPVAEARVVLETDAPANETATDGGADEPTETAEPIGSGQEELCASARLIGCQETPCTSGIFSVRFIYEITGDGAGQGILPTAGVVCLAGRGVISVEVMPADSVTAWVDGEATITPAARAYFLIVTFRGLSAQDEWVFAAERGDGTRALARWQDGQFRGWTDG